MFPVTEERAEGIELKGYRFPAFGAEVTLEASGPEAEELLEVAASRVIEVSEGLTRFEPTSELSRINADPRDTVEAGPLMIRFVETALEAATTTGGLVDPTLLPELERAGYSRSMFGRDADPSTRDVSSTPHNHQAPYGESGLAPSERWKTISVDRESGTISRRPGVRLDAGGIGKGLAADLVAELMESAKVPAWSADCLGDVRVGGAAGEVRPITIASPLPGEDPIEILEIREGAIATSGTTKRAWTKADGTTAHHLIDPRTGLPAEVDLIQVTALAPTAVEAEARAKATLLSGLSAADQWLPHGGLVVDGEGRVHRLGRIGDSV